MKILCLHGVGSSGSILESQLAAFVRAADASYEYVYADGPYPSAKGPGMESFDDDEPCWSHTESYAPEHMAEALENLDATIEDLGPFDGVIGFSQGAATAISYLLRQQEQGLPFSFQWALCFSSVLAVSANINYAEEAIEQLISRKLNFGSKIDLDALTTEERPLVDVITRVVKPTKDHNSMLPDVDLAVYSSGDGTQAPRILVSALLDKRLEIPTVHMTGKKDGPFMRDMSEVARQLCDESMMKVLEHPGGHQPPQDAASARAAVAAMEWAIRRA